MHRNALPRALQPLYSRAPVAHAPPTSPLPPTHCTLLSTLSISPLHLLFAVPSEQGAPLAHSPFTVGVYDATPHAGSCEVRGGALNNVVARTPSSFEVNFRDRSGGTTQAVELDVFVVPQPAAPAPAKPGPSGSAPPNMLSFGSVGVAPADGATGGGGGGEGGTGAAPAAAPAASPGDGGAGASEGGSAMGSDAAAGTSAGGVTDVFVRQADDAVVPAVSAFELATSAAPAPKRGGGAGAGGGGGASSMSGTGGDGGDASSNSTPLGRRSKKGGKQRKPSKDNGTTSGAAVGARRASSVLSADATAGGAAGSTSAGGYDSADDELLTLADGVRTRRRAILVQVTHSRPLLMRSGPSLGSSVLGHLLPDQQVTVMEERIDANGDVRACVMFEEALPRRPLSPRLFGSTLSPSSDGGGAEVAPGTSPPGSATQPPEMVDVSLSGGAGSGGALRQAIEGPPFMSSSPGPQAGGSAALRGAQHTNGTPKPRPTRAALDRWGVGGGRTSISPLPSSPPAGAGADHHLGVAHSPTSRLHHGTIMGTGKWVIGWVTLRKNGQSLVTSRVQVEPWVRQRASLLWKAQQVTDKLQLGVEREERMLDPTGVGFAFGGVYPGSVHAKGVLHETHKVHMSISRAGRYLLHVRLHQAARPLPGSPFALVVRPNVAHASCTYLNLAAPLRGEVGLEDQDGCSLLLHTADRSGNACIEGGATMKVTCTQLPHVETNIVGALRPRAKTQRRGHLRHTQRPTPPPLPSYTPVYPLSQHTHTASYYMSPPQLTHTRPYARAPAAARRSGRRLVSALMEE